MLARLLLLFIIIPVVELFLLIEIGQFIGTLPTLLLIVITGFLGAYLVRLQGLQTLTRIQTELQTGKLPAGSIFDGAVILIAGAFLLTPGILTDAFGFLCLIPATRELLKKVVLLRVQRAIQQGQIVTMTHWSAKPRVEPDNVIIINPDKTDDK